MPVNPVQQAANKAAAQFYAQKQGGFKPGPAFNKVVPMAMMDAFKDLGDSPKALSPFLLATGDVLTRVGKAFEKVDAPADGSKATLQKQLEDALKGAFKQRRFANNQAQRFAPFAQKLATAFLNAAQLTGEKLPEAFGTVLEGLKAHPAEYLKALFTQAPKTVEAKPAPAAVETKPQAEAKPADTATADPKVSEAPETPKQKPSNPLGDLFKELEKGLGGLLGDLEKQFPTKPTAPKSPLPNFDELLGKILKGKDNVLDEVKKAMEKVKPGQQQPQTTEKPTDAAKPPSLDDLFDALEKLVKGDSDKK